VTRKSSRRAIECAAWTWEVQELEGRRYLAAPVLSPIPDQTVPAGKSLQVPLVASDADGQTLHYSFSSDNSNFTAQLHSTTNTWLNLNTTQGTMLFQLFNDIAPNTVATITGLVNSGFFNGLKFYQISKSGGSFIYGGSPTDSSNGGPGFRFDDEFNADTIFDGSGQLAMLNAGKDTNGSQFFITGAPARSADFNYTIWGQLVSGYGTLKKLFGVPVSSQDQPTKVQRIKSASIVTDKTDGVVAIKAKSAGTATVTVQVDDGHGGTSTQTIHVSAQTDAVNDPPILGPVSDMIARKNKSISFALSSTDPEGDSGEYFVQLADTIDGSASVNGDVVTFTPRKNFAGAVTMFVGVRAPGAATRGNVQNPFDVQEIQIGVGDLAGSGSAEHINLMAGSSTGKIAIATFADSDPLGKAADWSAVVTKDALSDQVGGIDWGDDVITNGTIVPNVGGGFSVVGLHTYANPGQYPITVTVDGNLGARLTLHGVATVQDFAAENGGILAINGTGGNDTIIVGEKSGLFQVTLNGVMRNYSTGGISRVQVFAMNGNDTVTIGSGVPATHIDGGGGNDVLNGGDGNDTLTGGAGKNLLNGNNGDDRINGSGGVDVIHGGAGNDRLYGNGGDDFLDGGAGVDHLFGGDGNDQLYGEGSNDKMFGEGGNDKLVGGTGADSEDGGTGSDQGEQDGSDILTSIESIV
jgi:cyclophilin family peptidyl-prolyl cis-trans isomerase